MLTHQSILDLLAECSSVDLSGTLYVLADQSGVPGLVRQLTRAESPWVSLFDGSRSEGALAAAPILFPIYRQKMCLPEYRAMLNWVTERGMYSSSLLFLFSPLPLPELGNRLAARMDATLTEDLDILLRFFDGRVFEQLLSALSPDQQKALLSVAHCWWFVDRQGRITKVDANFSKCDAGLIPLALTAIQEDLLIEASEPDRVAALLGTYVPEQFCALEAENRHDFVVRHSKRARAIGVHVTSELGLYCALALLYGEEFATQHNWPTILSGISSGEKTLTQAIEEAEAGSIVDVE